MSNNLARWMQQATPKQKLALAKLAKTSRVYLHHLAGGRRVAGPDLAQTLVKASRRAEFAGLPELKQELLCPSCRSCEFLKNHHA